MIDFFGTGAKLDYGYPVIVMRRVAASEKKLFKFIEKSKNLRNAILRKVFWSLKLVLFLSDYRNLP
jgi:hypothetical protein